MNCFISVDVVVLGLCLFIFVYDVYVRCAYINLIVGHPLGHYMSECQNV